MPIAHKAPIRVSSRAFHWSRSQPTADGFFDEHPHGYRTVSDRSSPAASLYRLKRNSPYLSTGYSQTIGRSSFLTLV